MKLQVQIKIALAHTIILEQSQKTAALPPTLQAQLSSQVPASKDSKPSFTRTIASEGLQVCYHLKESCGYVMSYEGKRVCLELCERLQAIFIMSMSMNGVYSVVAGPPAVMQSCYNQG